MNKTVTDLAQMDNAEFRPLKVLVGCESSGIVRDAFIAQGHHAVSCDLLPTERPGPHYLGDVRDILHRGWDAAIFHPPCTYLTVSANTWYKDQAERKSGVLVGAARRQAREDAISFFMMLWNAPIYSKGMENPIGVMSTVFRKPDQIIHPWQFGHPEQKATCLWLENLPRLVPTKNVYAQMMELPKRERERMHYLSPGADRWKERSKTFQGIAEAMASQWGNPALLHKRTTVIQQTIFQ